MAKENTVNIVIDTNMGEIKAELYPDVAPVTVKNFIDLIKKGFYNGLTFHRLIEGVMIQGGVLSMARAMNPDSAGSQFFIMHETSPHLDGQYAAFGKVTDGMNVVDKIATVRTDFNDRPLEKVVINEMRVSE